MNEPVEQAAFLGSIAEKLGRKRRTAVSPPSWDRKPWEDSGQELNPEAEAGGRQAAEREQLIRQFMEQLSALNAAVNRVSRADFGRVLSDVIAKNGVRSAISWDDGRLHELQLESTLNRNGIHHRLWRTMENERELRTFAESADMGITFAEMGLADTGTVLLMNGGGRGRLISLLPPVYVAVLPERFIYPRLSDGMSFVRSRIPEGLPACINFITGPSRTGDIEADLALGVHGPGKVHIILLQD
ncbi:L-lactate dehydrogenase complex protein LldG [Paenibacillus forsythiae]|uniref:L-lactate dehydrogenase complex protein LldG n=1 Tax=Paenibacillus forsythiae TaxID=365616 RepID=A0ABU3H4V2_9BACL|nr:lactate utilization protein C [Paenibacillus forsythiae]MDT3425839.1 L-lactate dehydrogenase complex protein LldG [Paenibacillus forsythiae]